MKHLRMGSSLVLLLLSYTLVATARLASIGESTSRFQAVGPAGLKINGSASQVSVAETDGRLTASVSLRDIKTGIGLRDRHTKKYLKVDAHPTTTLTIERAKLTFPADQKSAAGNATGDYILAGVRKPLAFQYDVKRTGSDYHVTARAVVDIRQHGIETPCYLGVCVDPNVKIIVSFKLREQA